MVTTYVNRKTKLFISLFVIIGLVFLWHQSQASANSADQPIKVYVDLEALEFDVSPIIKNGTTLVPFRPLFEAMDMKVSWDPATRLVKGSNESTLITLKIGEDEATVNDEKKTLLQPAEIMDNRTLVPLRFIGESTGAYVVWDPYNRDINIVSMSFMEENQLTKENLAKAMEDYFAARAEEAEEQKPDPNTDAPVTKPKPHIPATPQLLASLEGMYSGFRADFGGSECGGICWDLYTFLPNSKVVIGLPEDGGPETIQCSVDECLDYTYHNGLLQLSNGETLSLEQTSEGIPVINNIKLSSVKPVPEGYKLDHSYIFHGYNGLIGVNAAATSWTYQMSFNPDGSFESGNVTRGAFSTNVDPTHGATASEASGTYHIEGNTIKLSYQDGAVDNVLFFLHDDDPKDIQIGLKNFYVED